MCQEKAIYYPFLSRSGTVSKYPHIRPVLPATKDGVRGRFERLYYDFFRAAGNRGRTGFKGHDGKCVMECAKTG